MRKNPISEEAVVIRGKNLVLTDAIKNYVMEKLQAIEVFGDKHIEAVINLDIQKLDHCIDVLYKFDHTQVKVHASTKDLYSAIDKVFDRLQAKLRKYKTRLQHHHGKPLQYIDINVNVIKRPEEELIEELNEDIEAENMHSLEELYKPHEIVSKETRVLKTLKTEEAMMKMDLSNDQFMVFRAEEDQKIKVIYRRDDMNYGLIEPE
ncbi:MAG: Ribosome-associated factor Y [Chlamydiae bacterium]|nr:Ribosome-associated factor Y [Chlamydiota bacterium]